MSAQSDRKEFLDWLGRTHPSLDEKKQEKLLTYGAAIAASHPRLGLVSRGDLSRVLMRHVRECLSPALVELLPGNARILDVGSGAGLPGIPLGILREDIQGTLVESRERRAAFLERMVLLLGLPNLRVFPSSLEQLAKERPEELWMIAFSRAVRWTPGMIQRLEGFLSPEGVVVRFGSPDAQVEGVRFLPLDSDTPRAIQIWPRATWGALPGAR